MSRLSFVSLFFCLFCISFSAFPVQKEVQIISDGDYGLELDWSVGMTCGEMSVLVTDIVCDEDANSYICGAYQRYLQFSDGTKIVAPDYYNAGFVAKFDKSGTLLWVSNYRRYFRLYC